MIQRTRQITTVGMLCAMAYALVALVRVPLVLFLEYEPKDVVIAIGGLSTDRSRPSWWRPLWRCWRW